MRISDARLVVVEIHREDIATLRHLMGLLRESRRRFLLYCDDLSFDRDETSYKSLKSALEGGIEEHPSNVLFYATSNRRHLMRRDMMENERSTAIAPSGRWRRGIAFRPAWPVLGFHNCGQGEYLAMIEGYAAH